MPRLVRRERTYDVTLKIDLHRPVAYLIIKVGVRRPILGRNQVDGEVNSEQEQDSHKPWPHARPVEVSCLCIF